MIERLLENWLDNADERGLQLAFQQMLVDQGYHILHSTRHAPIEHGKDVIAIDSSGAPCAFQLKSVGGKKLSKTGLSAINNQLDELVTARIEHPSLKTKQWHKSFLVLNGELEEEASDLLTKKNEGWEQRGHPENQVYTVVRGQLLEWAKDMSGKLLPKELTLFRMLLELYLEEGEGMLQKAKFVDLMLGSLPLNGDKDRRLGTVAFKRMVSSTALINAIAVSSYTQKKNYFAEIESWIIYLAHVFALAEKHGIEVEVWQDSFNIIEEHLHGLLTSLVEELQSNPSGLEGDILTKQPFYRARLTLLSSLVSVFCIWDCLQESNPHENNELAKFGKSFVLDNRDKIHLWGEAVIPQIIVLHWYLKRIDATPAPDWMLAHVLEALCARNRFGSTSGLPSPYYDVESAILSNLGAPGHIIEDSFAGGAYTAEALMHLFVRSNWKQYAKLIWPDYTRMMVNTIELEKPWQAYMWRISENGLNLSTWPERRKTWDSLKAEAFESEGHAIPSYLKRYPHLFLLFLIVYPHRCTSESVRWLDTHIKGPVC